MGLLDARFATLFLASMAVLALMAPMAGGATDVGTTAKTNTKPAVASGYVRYDEFARYLWGNLTWTADGGRIVWGPTAEAEGGGGTPNANDEILWEQGDEYEGQTGKPLAPYPGPDTFTSDPFPRKAYLDVTRNILIDLNIKDNAKTADACKASSAMASTTFLQLDLEMFAGNDILGGAVGHNSISWTQANANKARPSDPDGYSACHFAVSPEVAILQEGTVLKVKVLHVMQQFHFTFGFGGAHPSTIRIPLYSAEDILFRYPGEDGPGDAPVIGDSGGDTGGNAGPKPVAMVLPAVPALGFAGLAIAAGTGRRRSHVAVLLAIAVGALAFSGCLTARGAKAPAAQGIAQGGVASQAFEKDLTGELVDEVGTGTVFGQVFDDLHIPVPDVHISIIGQPQFTKTDSKGRFQFLNLLPGVYKVRFDKTEYKSFEAEVEVKEGFVTKPSIMLYLVNPTQRDYRPHSHDYWVGLGDTKVAYEGPVAVACPGTPPACPVQGTIRLPTKDKDPNSVLPGTYTIDVTLAFNDDLETDVLGLYVKTSEGLLNSTYYPPRASGVPFHIPTSWEMTDPGHAPYSYWVFTWSVPKRALQGEPETTLRDATVLSPQPSLAAKIVLHKGPALPLEPKHPDDWAGKADLTILKDGALSVPLMSTQPPPASPTWSDTYGKMKVNGLKKIPFGTKTLDVMVVAGSAPLTDFHWVLRIKPANIPPHMAAHQTWVGYRAVEPTLISSDERTTTWKIPLKSEETDFVYAKSTTTGWSIYVEPSDYTEWWRDSVTRYWANYQTHAGETTGAAPPQTLKATITAIRDPAFVTVG